MTRESTPRTKPAPVTTLGRTPAAPPRVLHLEPGQRMALSGRVDAASVADVRLALRDAVEHGIGELELDVTGLELGDATGLGVLLGAHRHAVRAGRSLVLVNVPDSLHRLLAATRLARVLRVRQQTVLGA